MEVERIINVIDSHTAGEPTRVVVGGMPYIPGATMQEKKLYMRDNMDNIRQALMLEPRGHNDMFGAIITAPSDPAADMGILFMENEGYLNMCGHGTIGTVTVMLETGIIKPTGNETNIILDTPAGLVKATGRGAGDEIYEVSFQNVPSFLYEEDVKIVLKDKRIIKADVAFGGNFFALVDVEQLGLKISREHIKTLIQLGMEIKEKINRLINVKHPLIDYINTIDLVEFYEHKSAINNDARNVVIFGNSQYDRSPCGTGTCAKAAALYAKNKIQVNEGFINESIYDTRFKARIIGTQQIGNYKGIIPEVTGRAFITGMQNVIINKNDPFKYGLK